MKKSHVQASIAMTLVTSLGGVGVASAATAPHTSLPAGVSKQQVVQLTNYLADGGGASLQRGEIHPNMKAANQAFGPTQAKQFESQWESQVSTIFKAAKKSESMETQHGVKAFSYTSCLLNFSGLGGLTAVANKIQTYIEKHAWEKVVEIGLKEAAKRGIRIAVKGGVAGAIASLAVGAGYCAFFG